MNLGIESIYIFSILNSSPGSFLIPSCARGSLGEQHYIVYEAHKKKASSWDYLKDIFMLKFNKMNYP